MIPYESLGKVNERYQDLFQTAFWEFQKKGWYILGAELKQFETDFANYHHISNCVGVANGLDALELALRVLNLPADSEVIVPSNTYIASILGIIHAGLKPVLVEPDLATYNIDPSLIESAITVNTRAIMVVHLYGKCCDMDAINATAKKYSLSVIEDCAQSHDARYKGKLSGTLGDFGAFSFYPSKNLGALGDAGAVLTNNDDHANALKCLRNYGSQKKYFNDVVGLNSRLDDLQAMFLKIKLPYLSEITNHKRQLAKLYLENLKADFVLPVVDPDFYDVYHIFNIRHAKRDQLKAYLLENGIGAEIHYPVSPNKQLALKQWFGNQQYPISEEIHATTLSLPCSSCHSEADIFQVIEILNAF
jgi:dTDP-4-amino-4,6-dideoxygalactose transaminase